MTDAARQRTNMVESQILTSDVTDRRILQAMGELPRERFVPADYAAVCYMDEAVPLTVSPGGGTRRWLMAPRVFAKLLQLAEIGVDNRVLDVGSGSGYSAAVLGRIAKTVVALESDAKLAQEAQKNMGALALDNVRVVEGPLADGWVDEGPYDAIVLGGSVPQAPAALLDQLKDGGRLVGVIGQTGLGKGVIWRRLGKSADMWTAFDAAAPALPGFEVAAVFAL